MQRFALDGGATPVRTLAGVTNSGHEARVTVESAPDRSDTTRRHRKALLSATHNALTRSLGMLPRYLATIALAVLTHVFFLQQPTAAQGATDDDIINLVRYYLEEGGIDLDSYDEILPSGNVGMPESEHGINPDTGNHLIRINVLLVRQILKQIADVYGSLYDIEDPIALARFLFLALHEMQHHDCCHTGGDEESPEYKCRELQTHINAASDLCAYIAALVATLNGQPPSEFMSELLHLLCMHHNGERLIYNNEFYRQKLADCKAWSDAERSAGRPGGCECTSDSWEPPKPNPCADCPDFPIPGGSGNELIPICEACQHI